MPWSFSSNKCHKQAKQCVPVIFPLVEKHINEIGLMIQEVTHEADEIRQNNTELYDTNRLKQGMGEQARGTSLNSRRTLLV